MDNWADFFFQIFYQPWLDFILLNVNPTQGNICNVTWLSVVGQIDPMLPSVGLNTKLYDTRYILVILQLWVS